MKIIRLQSSNILRLVAIDITPEGNLITIGGPNGAGKSSVLNSIAMALGGLALAPEEPIRTGEAEAKIVVDLDDIRVTRRFTRDVVHETTCASVAPQTLDPSWESGECDCNPSWSETRSTLTVTSLDGLASYKSPQAMLDKLLGKLTFDPLAFKDDKNQAATLRALVGIDTSKIDAVRAEAFAERARLKKHADAKAAVAASMPFHEGAVEIPMAEISAEMQRAEDLRRAADEADRTVDMCRNVVALADKSITETDAEINAIKQRIQELSHQLDDKTTKSNALHTDRDSCGQALNVALEAAQKARTTVPDAGAIRARLTEAEAVNARVRANNAKSVAVAEAELLAAQAAEQHEIIVNADEEKRRLLAEAKFPVEGLGIGENGITFGGVPLSQASSSEQLRVSTAIGLALNPKLRVLLVRNGNILDEEHMALLAKQAEDASAQLWVEYVSSSKEGVSVFIEDGRVA